MSFGHRVFFAVFSDLVHDSHSQFKAIAICHLPSLLLLCLVSFIFLSRSRSRSLFLWVSSSQMIRSCCLIALHEGGYLSHCQLHAVTRAPTSTFPNMLAGHHDVCMEFGMHRHSSLYDLEANPRPTPKALWIPRRQCTEGSRRPVAPVKSRL